MVSVSGLGDSLGIVNSAAALLKKDIFTVDNAKTAGKFGLKAYHWNRKAHAIGGAITQYSAQTTIMSRVFVDETILDEPVLPHLLKSAHEWYAAQIISALQLARMVTNKQNVQDVMSVLQTGHNHYQQSTLGRIADRWAGQESFLANLQGGNSIDPIGIEALDPMVENAKAINKATHDAKDVPNKNSGSSISLKSVNVGDNRLGPIGELYEVTITNPDNKDVSSKIPVFVQMQPSIIPAEVAVHFIDLNVEPAIWQRWTQMRAGEISFWKDFIAQRDRVRHMKMISKDPATSAAYIDFLKTVANKDKYALMDLSEHTLSKTSGALSSNLANSVVVFSEETVQQAKVDSNIDLHNSLDRTRYFRDTYTMIIAVVDAIHQRVTIYFNGIDGSIDSGYGDFKSKEKGYDPKDFMAVLQAFSAGSANRIR